MEKAGLNAVLTGESHAPSDKGDSESESILDKLRNMMSSNSQSESTTEKAVLNAVLTGEAHAPSAKANSEFESIMDKLRSMMSSNSESESTTEKAGLNDVVTGEAHTPSHRGDSQSQSVKRKPNETITQTFTRPSGQTYFGKPLELYTVDAFTSKPFSGNTAAVVLAEGADYPSDRWMQLVGSEMNLAETSFVAIQGSIGDVVNAKLRWFTPTTEVELCGHATLAAAKVLFAKLEANQIKFHTIHSGTLTVTRAADGMLEMDFPACPPVPVDAEKAKQLKDALPGLEVVWAGHSAGTGDYVAEVTTVASLEAMVPDLPAIAALGGRGVIVTARQEAGGAGDISSRCFFPNIGINEDPVTGSAHCVLGPHWASQMQKGTIKAHQCSKRGGNLEVVVPNWEHLDAQSRVTLRGDAVIVTQGSMLAVE